MFTKEHDVFNVLLGSVSEGVVVVDALQTITETNASADKMFGYNRHELIGQHLNVLIPNNYHPSHAAHFKGFMKDQERRQMGHGRDIFGKRKDGSIFPVEAGLNPFQLENKDYVMALVIDISVRKEHERKITELNTELELKIEKRTKELNDSVLLLKTLNEELQIENNRRIDAENKTKKALQKEIELNELKTKFLSLVSHEFKTPLSGILTSAMLLGKYQLSEQQEKRDKHIKTITEKVHYLNNILNDFLSLEKLELGKVDYKYSNFKISKIVNEVVYNANMLLKEGQQIKYPEHIDDLSLIQDEKIMELALSNLIHNAIKYSPEHSIIYLEIKQNNTETTFKVIDNGMGVPEKDQKNIFNRYFRAENALLTHGTGIGLNIVQTHLENLGGHISFESEENKGSNFIITIPNQFTP
ncbi:PAS domain-containing sensor histidine kinase [Mariniflexile sp. AS56]|uniref:PAS domain-containing sensor histidine kinase n=1 Tax=Mariniflexile sp. AS56 TaxID=3063957 RepID=UPI0026EFBAEC|nr:PAS domain-containing sensor histidine kinase [Mariniflexile sp. AS56]MDO7171110.1 PAS domain-containing sensor histidine kinase [Mariniflexile sp. AS56]